MDSEEMREELESFVNQGIKEGWNGWPVKDWSFATAQCRLGYGEVEGVEPLDFTQESPFPIWSRLDRLFQTRFQNMNRLS
jgi:hypothetical protein